MGTLPKPTESKLVSACLDDLAFRKILAWRAGNHGVYDPARKCFRSFRGLRGVSDVLGCLAVACPFCGRGPVGRLLAAECKLPGGRVSPEQAAFLAAVRGAGGVSGVVHDLTELAALLGGS